MIARTLLAVALCAVGAGAARAQVAPATPVAPVAAAQAAVTYRVGGSVYVDAGQEQGLAAGDTLIVRRAGAAIARLVARDVAARRAACDTLAGGGAVQVGDDVTWRPRTSAPAAQATADSAAAPAAAPGAPAASTAPPQAAAAPARPTAAPRHGASRTRGRIGLSAWSVSGSGVAGSFQPAADGLLDARGIAPGLDFALDVRGRGTYRTGSATLTNDEMKARVYRASFTLHDAGGGRSLAVGRQLASPLASVSLFDGALATATGSRWAGGVLLGTQPEPVRLAPSTDLVEGGAYVEVHAHPGAGPRWTASLGGVTSSMKGQPNRDFLFEQAYYQDRRTSLWLAQEFDVASGWRRNFQAGRIALTSTFASARFDVASAFALRAGYDGRRDVPLYRDRLTPETQFDDALRQGAWVGATLRGGPGLRVDGDLRRRFADVSGGASDAVSSMVEWAGVRGVRPRLRARYARSSSDLVVTTLASFGGECSPGASTHVGLTGGTRRTEDRPSATVENAPWWSVDADVALLRAWSLAGSFDHEGAPGSALDQAYLGFAYRF